MNQNANPHELLEHRVETLENGLREIDKKLDSLLQGKSNRIPPQLFIYVILGCFSIISMGFGSVSWMVSSKTEPVNDSLYKLEKKIQNIEVMRGIERGEIATLQTENDENKLFRDRWYNHFKILERLAKKEGKLEYIEESLNAIKNNND